MLGLCDRLDAELFEEEDTMHGNSSTEFFPSIEPYHTGLLSVGHGHEIYYEECGNPNGFPLVFFHGGPGAGCDETDRRFFNPARWRIILFDQRGSGRSNPFGGIEHNTTWDLVSDFSCLVEYLGVRRAVFFGGSWGSTLALLCAIKYPELLSGMVLRGIFLGESSETEEYLGGGAARHFPEAWERFISHVPLGRRHNAVEYFYEQMTVGDKTVRARFAYEWAHYELSMLHLVPPSEDELHEEIHSFPFVSLGIMEAHYIRKNCFLEPGFILDNVHRIPQVPIIIVQGRYDVVCAPVSAYKLGNAFPHATLHIVLAGHSSTDPEIKRKLIVETEVMYEKVSPS